jgi:hypothetical protein
MQCKHGVQRRQVTAQVTNSALEVHAQQAASRILGEDL